MEDNKKDNVLGDNRYAFGTYESTQKRQNTDKKNAIAEYHVIHHLLVPNNANADDYYRDTSAHIFVAPGTAPYSAMTCSLEWMEKQWEKRPFTITWYTTDTPNISAILDFKRKHPVGISAAGLFICCRGEVDQQLAFPVSPEAAQSLENISVKMNEAFLGAHRFDPATGEVYFYFEREVPLQRAAAMIKADRKLLFLDDSKLKSYSGTVGYDILDMIRDARSLTIYSSESDEETDNKTMSDFEEMIERRLKVVDFDEEKTQENIKKVELILVNNYGESVKSVCKNVILAEAKNKRKEKEGGGNIKAI